MSSLEQAMCPETPVFLFFINAGAFVTVHVVIRLIQEQKKQPGCVELLCDFKNESCNVLIVESTYENGE